MRMCAASKRKFRAHLMSRVASVALLAGLAAGCSSDVSRFSEPFFAGSTSNQKSIIARNEPAPVDQTYTGSINRNRASSRHVPSVNDPRPRSSDSAVATHNSSSRPSLPSRRNAVEPVTQSRLDPLPPLPAKVSARTPDADPLRSRPETSSFRDADVARARPQPVSPSQSLPPMPARVTQSSVNASDRRVASLPASRPGSPRPPSNDPIQTGSLPPANRDDQTSAPPAISAGWSSTGGSLVTVGRDESGPSLARRYGVPLKAILVANNMSNPNAIQPGQRVVIPTYVYAASNPAQSADKGLPQGRDALKLMQRAPVPKDRPGRAEQYVSRAPVSSGSSSRELNNGQYTVRPGDSVAAISQKFNIAPAGLRSVNGLAPDALLWIGQKLRIPASSAGTQVASLNSAPPVAPAETTAPIGQAFSVTPSPKPLISGGRKRMKKPKNRTEVAAEVKSKPQAEPRVVVASRTDAGAATDANPVKKAKQTAAKSQGTFSWPAKGPVISRFGRKANGERNDGINISVPRGAPVHAAEKGVVIYSGNELKGYGNLVLVRHAEGWVSAYAHNSSLSVKRGDAVNKGQVIAKAGDTGSVSEPQIHFELRRNSKPVDPIPLMARK